MESQSPLLPRQLQNLPKSLTTLLFIYILMLNMGESSAQPNVDVSNTLKIYPSPSIYLDKYNSNFALNMTLASALRYVTGSLDPKQFEENMNRVISYTSADEAITDSFALNLATMSAFNNLLFSAEYEQFRDNNDISSVDKLVDAVLHLTITLDFDRSIDDAVLEVNPETGEYEVVGTALGGAQQAYINELQVKLVAGRWVYHRNKVLEQYASDTNIVIDGELTDIGLTMALIEFANWSNIFRVIGDVSVFRDADISFQVGSLINKDVRNNPNLIQMITEHSSDPESFLMLDYNVFYPGSGLYEYLLAIVNNQIKPHKGIKAVKYHDGGGIEVYYDMNYKEEIRLGFDNQTNISVYYLSDTYLGRLSDFQKDHILTKVEVKSREVHENLALEP